MNDTSDPYLVTSPLGITSVLRTLVAHKTLIHMRPDRHPQAIITTVLDIDPEQKQFIVDAAANDIFNERLARASQIHFDAQIDKIRVHFRSSQAQQLVFDKRPAFLLPYPDALQRMQRRHHFRIDIPVSTPLFCDVPLNAQRTVTLPVKDISAGGIALLDAEKSIDGTAGSVIKGCQLELTDIGTVMTDLKIRRISDHKTADDKSIRTIACEFDRPAPPDAIMIQNYIGRLDRLLNARRRGFD